jgi:ABC-2 type transport system permease protein
MVPAIGMRLWAEEKKTGTIEVLFSLPVTVAEAVLGKFIAAWTLISVALLLTLPIVFTVNYLGDPDNFVILCGYIGAFLLSGCYLSISIFCSSLTGNQVTAFILSVVLCSLFVFADYPSFLNIFYGLLPVGIIEMIENMSFVVHFESIRRGVVEFGDISFYILIIVCWLACTCIVLDAGKDS